jgi:hypothetical protein
MPDFPLPHLDIPGLGQGSGPGIAPRLNSPSEFNGVKIAPACRRLALAGRDFGLKKSNNFSLLKLPE